MVKKLYKKGKHIVRYANLHGIPIPMVRDPKTGIGSVSLTLLVVSSIMVIIGCAGKWSGFFGAIDFHEAIEFFYASSALYFGRNWKTGAKDTDNDDDDDGRPSKSAAADVQPPK